SLSLWRKSVATGTKGDIVLGGTTVFGVRHFFIPLRYFGQLPAFLDADNFSSYVKPFDCKAPRIPGQAGIDTCGFNRTFSAVRRYRDHFTSRQVRSHSIWIKEKIGIRVDIKTNRLNLALFIPVLA